MPKTTRAKKQAAAEARARAAADGCVDGEVSATARAVTETAPVCTWLAVDCSGSVTRSEKYFCKVQQLFDKVSAAERAASAKFLVWNTTVVEKSCEAMAQWIHHRSGSGGTNPSCLAEFIKNQQFHGVLILVTDGYVSASEVDACDGVLRSGAEQYSFEHVQIFIVQTQLSSPDLSVGAAFARFSSHVREFIPLAGQSTSVSVDRADQELFDAFVQKKHMDLETLEAAAEKLKSVAVARFILTAGSVPVRDAAIQAKNRITAQMSRSLGGERAVALRRLLDDRRFEEAREEGRLLSRDFECVSSEQHPVMQTLNAIIGLCEGAARSASTDSAIAQAISKREQRVKQAPMPAETLPLAPEGDDAEPLAASEFFRCPVPLDDSPHNVVLMLAKPEGGGCCSFFDVLDAESRERVGTNPLWLWRLPEQHIRAFVGMLDELLSCQALRDARAAGLPIKISTTTRRPLAAAFPLSTASEEHGRARQWALLQAVAGGRKWGNPELWFVNLALAVQRKLVSERLQQALPLVLDCLRWQLRNSRTYASLSGLPELPMTLVPTDVAAWLVASSPTFDFPKMALAFLPSMTEVLWVVEDVMGYDLPCGGARALDRLRIVQSMRAWKLGKAPLGAAPFEAGREAARLGNLMTALRQRALRLDAAAAEAARARLPPHFDILEFVELDGEPDVEQRRQVLERLPPLYRRHAETHGGEELVALAALADVNKKPAGCVPPLDFSPASLDAAIVEWSYGVRPYARSAVPLCPATARPYIHGAQGPWKEVAERFYGFAPAPAATLSAHEYFGRFVVARGFYPTATELVIYLRQRWVVSGTKTTLPHLLDQFVDETLTDALPLTSALDASEFTRRFLGSMAAADRLVMEKAAARGACA